MFWSRVGSNGGTVGTLIFGVAFLDLGGDLLELTGGETEVCIVRADRFAQRRVVTQPMLLKGVQTPRAQGLKAV